MKKKMKTSDASANLFMSRSVCSSLFYLNQEKEVIYSVV